MLKCRSTGTVVIIYFNLSNYILSLLDNLNILFFFCKSRNILALSVKFNIILPNWEVDQVTHKTIMPKSLFNALTNLGGGNFVIASILFLCS